MRARWTLVVLGAVSMLPGPARAQDAGRQTFITAPYDKADASASCVDVSGLPTDDLTKTCVANTAKADAQTGAIDIDLRAKTPQEGTLPGVALLNATASIDASHVMDVPANAVLYVATVSIGDVTLANSAPLRLSTLTATIDVGQEGCACHAVVSRDLTVDDAHTALLLPAVLTNTDGAAIPAGTTTITVRIDASSTLAGIGAVATQLHASLDQIEAAKPSLERLVTPPYAAAEAFRTCSGSLGTTFSCRSAAARSTGRVEMNLGVTSPVAGTVPGSGTSTGTTATTVEVTPTDPVRAAAYILTLHVSDAEAFTSVTSPVLGSAVSAINATSSIAGAICTCRSFAGTQIVGLVSRPSVLDTDVPFVMWTVAGDSGSVGKQAQIELNGMAQLQNASGQALATLSAAVASVRVVEIA